MNDSSLNYIILGYFILIGALFVGWIINLVKVVELLSEPITGMFILRVAGIIFVPVGGVLGYIPA